MALTHLLLEVLPQWLDPPLLIRPFGVLIAVMNEIHCVIFVPFSVQRNRKISCTGKIYCEKLTFTEGPTA